MRVKIWTQLDNVAKCYNRYLLRLTSNFSRAIHYGLNQLMKIK
jgi:hypothetical protein